MEINPVFEIGQFVSVRTMKFTAQVTNIVVNPGGLLSYVVAYCENKEYVSRTLYDFELDIHESNGRGFHKKGGDGTANTA